MEVTHDIFLGGAVSVFQPKAGFRAGTDSVLLAAALDETQRGDCLEIGCGAGGALIPAAWRLKQARFVGIDRDADMVELASRGVATNGFADRVEIIHANASDLLGDWADRFDLVFSNPPFFRENEIKAPGPGKSAAYLESLPLENWLRVMLRCVRPKGHLVMIHRAAVLGEILHALHGRVGEVAVLPVRSYPGSDAKRVIVRARKGLRPGPLRLLSGVDLYAAKGGPRSDTAQAISATGAGLDWSTI